MAIESKMNRTPLPLGSPYSQSRAGQSRWVWIVLVILIVLGIGWYFTKSSKKDVLEELQGSAKPTEVIKGEYQAVFLDNGQTYFGKLDIKGGEFMSLTDVFYLQPGASPNSQQGNLALSKLGSEAHGPEDKMSINKSHVLFIENLKSDSKVVKAIQQYKSK